mmetsp:Transcript_27529/g.49637  ORF Transcript_27529/g.49637 Transcript_27529/m.49637 type:complete len:604 (-) Transcript_27529:70-1881(-)
MALVFTKALEDASQLDTDALRDLREVLKANEGLLKRNDTTEELKVESIPDHYLTVKTPNLKQINFERPTVHDASILRSMIIGLSHQLATVTADAEEIEILRTQIDQSNKARSELQETVEETVQGLTRDNKEILSQCKRLEEERENAIKEFDSVKSAAFKLEKQLEMSEAENSNLKRTILELQVRQAANSEHQVRHLAIQQELKDSQKVLRALQLERESEKKELERLKHSLEQERTRLTNEKSNLNRHLTNKSGEVDRLTEENLRLRSELLNLRLENHGGSESDSRIRAVEEMLKQSFLARDALRSEFEELTSYSKQLASQIAQLEQKNSADLMTLQKTVETLREQLAQEKQSAKSLLLKVSEQESHIEALEEIACVKEDFASMREDLLQQVSMNRLVKHETLDELDALAQYNIIQAQRNKAQSDLLAQTAEFVQDQTAELEEVKYKLFLEKNAETIYKPAKGDLVDEALAQYLSERSEKVPVPFIRESKDVYSFGTKRIFVRVDQGKISVRVGGGFMPIEDFISVYSKAELEKFELRAAQRSPTNVSKMIGRLASSGGMSPKKAAQIIAGSMEKFTDYTTCFGVTRSESRKQTLQSRTGDEAS